MTSRSASCCCGQLRVETEGEPVRMILSAIRSGDPTGMNNYVYLYSGNGTLIEEDAGEFDLILAPGDYELELRGGASAGSNGFTPGESDAGSLNATLRFERYTGELPD